MHCKCGTSHFELPLVLPHFQMQELSFSFNSAYDRIVYLEAELTILAPIPRVILV
jgi:hypothetical protein